MKLFYSCPLAVRQHRVELSAQCLPDMVEGEFAVVQIQRFRERSRGHPYVAREVIFLASHRSTFS